MAKPLIDAGSGMHARLVWLWFFGMTVVLGLIIPNLFISIIYHARAPGT